MSLEAARVTLKLHRFEVGISVLAALVVTALAGVIELRTALVSVPPGCFEIWRTNGPDGAGQCLGPIRAWATYLSEDGTRIIAAMAYLPFGIGVLSGAPIVAGELEARTAQLSWSLYGSRGRWLRDQLLPILAALGLAMIALAIGTAVIENDRAFFGYSRVEDLGLSGASLLPRAFAAFGLSLLAGALTGRTLSAFVLGLAATVALVVALGWAREAWQRELPAEMDAGPQTIITAVLWKSPDGEVLTTESARERAHAAGAPLPPPGDAQDEPALAWLSQHDYAELDRGISADTALQWAYFDGLLFTLVGVAAVAGTVWAVRRRRPT